MIGQLDVLLVLLHEFEELQTSAELLKVNRLLKKISLKNELISKCMIECQCTEELRRASDFGGLIKDLRIASTDTPNKQRLEDFADSKGCPAYVRDGIINWASERRTEIEVAIEELKAAVFQAQLKLNRA